jgi:hypothetical protein
MKPLPAGYPPTSEPDFTPLRLLANPPDRVNCLRLHRQRREAGRYVDGVVDRLMDQTGHTDPGFTLRVYRHSVRRDQESKDQLRALVGVDGPGTNSVSGTNSGTNRKNEGVTSMVVRNGR